MKKAMKPLCLILALCLCASSALALEYELTSIYSYPVATEDTLTVWVSGGLPKTSDNVSYNDNHFLTKLAELTGITVDYQSAAAGADASQAFNLMLASDAMTDIIWGGFDAAAFIADGIIIPLNDKIETGMPDYWAWLSERPEMKKAVTTDDGDIFGIRCFRESDWLGSYMGPAVRKDWLEACGLEVPTTIDGWTNVLTIFKEQYGATFAGLSSSWSPANWCLTNAYGVIRSFFIDQESDTIVYGPVMEGYKEYLTQMNTWWEAGLIDPDFAALDGNTLKAKVMNDKVGLFFTTGGTLTGYLQSVKELGSEAEFTAVPYPVLDEGDEIWGVMTEKSVTGYMGTITTACENVDLAMAYLNYPFTEDGNNYWNFGIEGETYEVVDGVEKFSNVILGASDINNAINTYTGMSANGMGIQAKQMYINKTAETAVDAINTWTDAPQYAFDYCVPALSATVEETEEISAAQTAIDTYMMEMYYKFIMGDESIDNFDTYVATINGMGLEKVLAVKNAQYTRYLAR